MSDDLEVIKTYNYWDNIKKAQCAKGEAVSSGNCMGFKSDSTDATLEQNRIGLESYLSALQYGYYNSAGGINTSSKANGGKGGPLGNRYFFITGGKCLDSNKQEQTRYKYMNNIPNSSGGANRGLVPGMIGNIGKLNPVQILNAFTESSTPPCRQVTLNVVDGKGKDEYETQYISDADAKRIDPCAFKPDDRGNHRNPLVEGSSRNAKECRNEPFVNMFTDNYTSQHKKITNNTQPHSHLPDDPLTNVYIFALSLFGIYIVKKVTEKI